MWVPSRISVVFYYPVLNATEVYYCRLMPSFLLITFFFKQNYCAVACFIYFSKWHAFMPLLKCLFFFKVWFCFFCLSINLFIHSLIYFWLFFGGIWYSASTVFCMHIRFVVFSLPTIREQIFEKGLGGLKVVSRRIRLETNPLVNMP